jgi:energy-coupling factor transport system permease protein
MRVNLYLDRASVLERLHPELKLGLLAATFASAYGIAEPLLLLPVAAAEAALIVVAGALPNVRRFRPMFIAVPVATFLIWSFFYGQGEPLSGLPLPARYTPSAQGIEYAAGMALKLEIFLASSVLFLSITRVEEFTEALRGLGMPYRMSFAVTMAFRLVPLFLSSALSVVVAQRARGLDFSRGNVFQRLARYVPVIVPVFMGALRRADAMAMALETRGFGRAGERTTFVRSRFGAHDLVAGALMLVVVAVYLWAALSGYGRPWLR